jgi:hypothetical protein
MFVCVDFGVYIFKVTGSSARPRDAHRRRIAGHGGGHHQGSPRSLLQCRQGRAHGGL